MKTFRYSAIDTSQRCLQKYKYQYIDGLQGDVKSSDLKFGSALHIGLYSMLSSDDLLGEADPQVVFSQTWDEAHADDLIYYRKDWFELRDMGVRFLTKFAKLHAKKYKPVHLEAAMKFTVGKYAFTGTADFIGEYNGVPSVVDFKTSSFPYSNEKIVSNPQMYLYAHAAKQAFGYEAKQVVYTVFVKNPECRIQTIIFPLTDGKLTDMVKNVEQQCDLLTAIKSYPQNSNSCMMGTRKCPFWRKCFGTDKKD